MICIYYCGISKKWHADLAYMSKISHVTHNAVRVQRAWKNKIREFYLTNLGENLKTFNTEEEAIVWCMKTMLITPVYLNHKVEGRTYFVDAAQ